MLKHEATIKIPLSEMPRHFDRNTLYRHSIDRYAGITGGTLCSICFAAPLGRKKVNIAYTDLSTAGFHYRNIHNYLATVK